MPFDPNIPAQSTPNSSAQMRAQLNGLKELIDAVPAGPPGPPGEPGATGAQGEPGAPGADGTPGEPFAQAVVDSVTTLDPGQPATVAVSFDGSNVHFEFGVPRGSDGGEGPPGAPGEVSAAQLADAVAGTSANSNGVNLLGMTVSDPPTQSEVQTIADKLDELINALRRT